MPEIPSGIPISQIASSFPSILVPPRQRIAAGEFWMGADGADAERPGHRVQIPRDFWLGVYPVTVAEFRSFCPGHEPDADPQWPVVGVTWREADDYCAWLTDLTGDVWRLPSEAEWEYAARGGSSEADHCGEAVTIGRRAVVGGDSANGFGLHDMGGNVGEWVADIWHLGDGTDGATRRIWRGARSCSRNSHPEDERREDLGFRVACEV